MLRILLHGYLYRNLLSYNFPFYNLKKLRVLRDRFSEIFSKSHVTISYNNNLLKVRNYFICIYLHIFCNIYVIVGRRFLPPPTYWGTHLYCLSPFSKFCPPLPFRFQPPTPMFYFLHGFFDSMSNHATFDVIMPLWCYVIWCYDAFLVIIYILYFVKSDIKKSSINQLIPSHGQCRIRLNCLWFVTRFVVFITGTWKTNHFTTKLENIY